MARTTRDRPSRSITGSRSETKSWSVVANSSTPAAAALSTRCSLDTAESGEPTWWTWYSLAT
jgi:hypothetical protein